MNFEVAALPEVLKAGGYGRTVTAYAGADKVGYEMFGLKAFFDGNWKILWMPKPVGKEGWELFDLKNDPAEINDLSKTYPERLKTIIALWEQYKTDNAILDFSINLSGKN